jgi:hypothetical protein
MPSSEAVDLRESGRESARSACRALAMSTPLPKGGSGKLERNGEAQHPT